METKIYAVIDTNVIVSALFSISGQSNPAAIIRKVVDGTITPIFNEEILAEYKEVLSRDKFPFRKDDIDWIISIFQEYGIAISETKISEETFVDKKDVVFYEVALSKEDSFLVTGNLKHFPKKPFVVSPAEMIQIIHEMQQPKSGLLSEPAARYGTKGIVKPCKSRFIEPIKQAW